MAILCEAFYWFVYCLAELLHVGSSRSTLARDAAKIVYAIKGLISPFGGLITRKCLMRPLKTLEVLHKTLKSLIRISDRTKWIRN